MPVLRSLAIVMASLFLASISKSQTIQVSVHVNDNESVVGMFGYGQDVRIDLAAIAHDYPGFDFIRVIDTASTLGDISRVSLYRSTNYPLPTDVRLLIGARVANDEYPDRLTQVLLAGCRDWGLPLTNGGHVDALVIESTVPDDTRVILAGAVARDVTGPITCGQVFMLQATSGTIAADVRATWADDLGPNDTDDPDPDNGVFRDYCIQRITTKQITARIIAGDETGPPTDPPTNWNPLRCSIRSVVVGVGFDASSTGIQGDILAYGGHIRHIESTGPIGNATTPVKIHAGYGLNELFCTAQVNGVTVARNVHADLRTNFKAPLADSNYDTDGYIRNVRISGDLHGAVRCNIVRPRPDWSRDPQHGYIATNPGGNSAGMFIAGEVNAPIRIDQGVLISSLRAAQFNADIVIETYLKGEVIATGGGISSLDIGNTPHAFTINSPYFAAGFIASQARPDWDPAARYPFPLVSQDAECAREARGLIRAQTRIGYLGISQVVQGNKLVPAMIESPRFDVVRIGSLEYGVIWSGVRPGCTPVRHSDCSPPPVPPATECDCTTEYDNPGVRCGPDPADPASYASFGDVEIGDLVGSIIAPGFPEYDTGVYSSGFDRFDILRRHSAHLRLYNFEAAQHLRIGCSFGRELNNNSGQIFVYPLAPSQGPHGQITVNANAMLAAEDACAPSPNLDQDLGWWERVTIPATGPIDPIVIASNVLGYHGDFTSEADIAPDYLRLPEDIGDLWIGQAPFHLHRAACEPAYDGPGGDVPIMLTSEFQHQSYGSGACPPIPDIGGPIEAKTIILRAYGPIRAESSTSPPITIRLVNPQGGYDPVHYEDAQYTTITLEAPPGSPFVREIHIHGLDTQNLIEGVYHIRPKLTGTDRLLCDGLLTTDDVPFGENFTVEIELRADCNTNGVWDADDIAEEPLLDMWAPDSFGPNGKIDCCEPCKPDYNQDGNIDQDDVQYLVNVIAGASNPTGWNPDFNRDGNADQDDTAALVNTIGGGGCP